MARADGDLNAVRTDVRTSPPESSSSSSSSSDRSFSDEEHRENANNNGLGNPDVCLGILIIAGTVVSSPIWIPKALLRDDSDIGYFPRFPYDDTSGYLTSSYWPKSFSSEQAFAESLAAATGVQPTSGSPAGPAVQRPKGSLVELSPTSSPRRWGAQFAADYLGNFGHLSGVGGELILETTSRFGINTSLLYLTERFSNVADDHLNLGDCNLTYRFAQSEHVILRTGIGANWLNDSTRTDLGFNFTYGGDVFPCKPWVLSAVIDWGTLGHAGLFRFRTTAGVILNRFEGYVGYEYLDIGTTQGNFLIGGARIWF